MTHQDLIRRAESIELELDNHSRCYGLDDTHVLDFRVIGLGRERDGGEPRGLHVHLAILQYFPADDDATEGYEETDVLAEIPAQVLIRFAEMKTTIDRWMAGELAELPPSTKTPPAKHRRYAGRRLLRRR
jgi:hypothetical protein